MCLHTEIYKPKKVKNLNDSQLKGAIAVHPVNSRAGSAMVYRITGFRGPNNAVMIVDDLSIAPRYSPKSGENLDSKVISRGEHREDRIIYPEAIREEMQANGLNTQNLSKYNLRICIPLKAKR